MFIQEYPYTNFHEVNLDWLLKNMGKSIRSIAWTTPYKMTITMVDGTTSEVDNEGLGHLITHIDVQIKDLTDRVTKLEGGST